MRIKRSMICFLLLCSICSFAQSADKYVADFLSEKGTSSKSANRQPAPDLEIKPHFLKLPDEAVPAKDTTKKIRRKYEMYIEGKYIHKTITEYNRDGQPVKETMWTEEGLKTIQYANPSTGKTLIAKYSGFDHRLAIDTNAIKADTVHGEINTIAQISEIVWNQVDGGMMKRKLYPDSTAYTRDTSRSFHTFYDKAGYADSSIYTINKENHTICRYVYDKKHHILSATVAITNTSTSLFDKKTSYQFSYDSHSKPTEKTQTVEMKDMPHKEIETVHLITTAIYEYNNAGRLAKYTYHSSNGLTTTSHFSYPASDEVIATYRENDQADIGPHTITEHFDRYGHVIKREYHYPIPGGAYQRIRTEYDYY